MDVAYSATPTDGILFNSASKDEPISETEFKLLFVDLTQDFNENGTEIDYSGNNADKTDVKPTPVRGRGRPKGSKNKTYKGKSGKKYSKQGNGDHPHHSDIVLPDRLKKRAKVESDIIIDLTKRSLAPVTEMSFDLKDKIDLKTWKSLDKKAIVCTLCSKPGNFAVLGPLFGPYKIPVNTTNHDGKEARGQKTEKTLIVRLHKDCAIWAPGLCFVGSDLLGTGRMITHAAKQKCNACNEIGATLACNSNRTCVRIFHYVCARQTGCSFNATDCTIRCMDHK